jgi:hypothetical protein
MSHFTTIRTQIKEIDFLVKALADLQFKTVEVHQTPQHLYGYQGDIRADTAEVIVRRRYISRSSNDIGFKRQNDGTFQAIISKFDSPRYSQLWLHQLTQRYAYYAAITKLEEQGFSLVSEEQEAGERIHLVLRRSV